MARRSFVLGVGAQNKPHITRLFLSVPGAEQPRVFWFPNNQAGVRK